MSVNKLLVGTSTTLYAGGATLANNARKAADLDNTTNLDVWGDVELFVKYVTTAPSAGAAIGDLYAIPTVDGTNFASGGDGSVGDDHTPQTLHFVGRFVCVNPSTTTEERLIVPGVSLAQKDRFVLLNTSGQTYANTYTLKIQGYRTQTV